MKPVTPMKQAKPVDSMEDRIKELPQVGRVMEYLDQAIQAQRPIIEQLEKKLECVTRCVAKTDCIEEKKMEELVPMAAGLSVLTHVLKENNVRLRELIERIEV